MFNDLILNFPSLQLICQKTKKLLLCFTYFIYHHHFSIKIRILLLFVFFTAEKKGFRPWRSVHLIYLAAVVKMFNDFIQGRFTVVLLKDTLAEHVTLLVTDSVCLFLSQDRCFFQLLCISICRPSCVNHTVFCLCFLERSNGGDCHLGTAHSNTTQGRFLSFSWHPSVFLSTSPAVLPFLLLHLCIFLPSSSSDHVV